MARPRLRFLHKHGLGVRRLETGETTAPAIGPLFMLPSAEPTGTAEKGEMYFDSTANALMQYTGSVWEQVGASPSVDLAVAGDLTVGDDLTLTSTGAILQLGPTATDPVTLTQSANTLTLGTGDTFVADDITINDDLTLNSAGAIISIGDGANAVTLTHSTNTLTVGTGDTLVVDDVTIVDDLTLNSAGAVISIGDGANAVVLTHSTNTLTMAAGDTLAITTADKLTVGGLIAPVTIYENFRVGPHASVTEYDLLIAHRAMEVTAIKMVPSTLQGGALTGTVVKATGTATPVKTTTPMIAADALDFNAGAYTVVTPALTATGADLILAAGDRIAIDYSAALTTGHAVISIAYKYV